MTRDNTTPGRRMGMSSAWRRASKAFLAESGNQICGHCRAVPAVLVDHRQAHKGDHTLFWARSNWVASCLSCNSRKAVTTEGAFGRAPSQRAFEPRVRGVDADGWPIDPRRR